MVIDEALVEALLNASRDDAALVLLEGKAQVVEPSVRADDRFRGAAVILTRAELVDRLGTPSPSPGDVTRVAASLRDVVDKLGA
ncbi:hypothetical protein ACWD26_02060 [Streptomyces sp. NPDC002787]